MSEKLFHITEKGADIRAELPAGLTTFMTMAYILMVNAGMFAELPGVFYYAIYIATVLFAAIGTILIGLLANLPPGAGFRHGLQRILCLHRMHGLWTELRQCPDPHPL